MKGFLLGVIVFGLSGSGLAVEPEGQKVTMKGEYVWAREPDKTGPVEVEFTKVADGQWDAVFQIVWREEKHTYIGHANGSLDGQFDGQASEKDKGDVFKFTGSFADGKFTGSHCFIDKDKNTCKDSGTMTLIR